MMQMKALISLTMYTLASTPDSDHGRTRSVRNKENIPANNGRYICPQQLCS